MITEQWSEVDMQRRPAASDVAPHQVLHLVADRAESGPARHSHVVGLETATTDRPRRWPLPDVVDAFRRGERFHLVAGGDIEVAPHACPYCQEMTLTTRKATASSTRAAPGG